ncbi:hypothetical protein BRUCa_1864 [Brucella melitensis]|nr:hypothetical protein BM28_A1877 [Brucella melitensis M28]AEW14382.1 NADH:ubiquinone oxidoreductase, NADH-binding (51 kD) subunit [Brucella canis HSK A52141]AEW16970.1 NADH:ubiquinone oxidoreductase, NADH-binding (51 kD) subunit [Brucella abortus A13334]AIB18393.1 Hypothetical protein BSSP3_I1691 [Brucella suis bv. 2]AIB21780.1 Hypothetical protein BSPT1_I1704 [Brucella suis bv. 2]
MSLLQKAAREVSLCQSQLAAPGADLQRAILEGCCLHIASSMVPGFIIRFHACPKAKPVSTFAEHAPI